MIRAALILHWCCALGAVAPLSPQQEARLAGAVDGQDDLTDPAFEALVENVRGWTPGLGDAPIRLAPDCAAMLARPAEFRGDLCRIQGRLEQQTRLGSRHEDVAEWFIRASDGQPIVIYIVGAAGLHGRFVDGGKVEVDARFYKRVDAMARDGQRRSYPAFVGAFPRIGGIGVHATGSAPASDRLWTVAAAVVVLGIVFSCVLIFARRSSKRARGRVHGEVEAWRGVVGHGQEEGEGASLPEDAAEALAALKRKAQGMSDDIGAKTSPNR
ncbi:MAG: hypothetical protein L0219_07870 [Phycisphaerales bacterium]|nr:hypothetical protein [Phycisphaerales bacterium]